MLLNNYNKTKTSWPVNNVEYLSPINTITAKSALWVKDSGILKNNHFEQGIALREISFPIDSLFAVVIKINDWALRQITTK